MKLLKLLPLCFLCICFSATLFAQLERQPQPQKAPEQKGFDKSRLFFGGNFGLSFGDYTIINVSPQVGYRFNRYVAAGMGINGQYYSVKYNGYAGIDKDQYGIAGLNVFGRVYPIEQLFAQLQPEMNYTWGKVKYTDGSSSTIDGKTRTSLLIGAGGIIPTGSRAGITIMIQYDLLGEANIPPYGNKPIYGFGVNLGF